MSLHFRNLNRNSDQNESLVIKYLASTYNYLEINKSLSFLEMSGTKYYINIKSGIYKMIILLSFLQK